MLNHCLVSILLSLCPISLKFKLLCTLIIACLIKKKGAMVLNQSVRSKVKVISKSSKMLCILMSFIHAGPFDSDLVLHVKIKICAKTRDHDHKTQYIYQNNIKRASQLLTASCLLPKCNGLKISIQLFYSRLQQSLNNFTVTKLCCASND